MEAGTHGGRNPRRPEPAEAGTRGGRTRRTGVLKTGGCRDDVLSGIGKVPTKESPVATPGNTRGPERRTPDAERADGRNGLRKPCAPAARRPSPAGRGGGLSPGKGRIIRVPGGSRGVEGGLVGRVQGRPQAKTLGQVGV